MTRDSRNARDYGMVEVVDLQALRGWLEAHHDSTPGAWVVTGKKASDSYIAYDDIVREALRVGWIDSRSRAVDAHRTSRLLTPRKPASAWSRVNKDHIARLERAGDMHPAGRAAVRRARADGSWEALDAVEELAEPQDLVTALDATPAARTHWDQFPRSARRAILEWIAQAKTPTTRRKRIDETAAQAAQGRRANQWRQPKGGISTP